MAERRMFAKTIIDSDAFLDMPLSAQALYFHLSMRADDDGFVNNPRKIQRLVGAADDDLKLLIAKCFLITFESGIVVIKHWKIHNYIQSDRYKPTVYTEEKELLGMKENKAYTIANPGVYPSCIQDVSKTDTQVRLGKDSKGKDSQVKESKGESKHAHGEYAHVLLKDSEVEKLNADYGEELTEQAIKYLDEYIEMKGAKYKSHYLAIRKWVIDAVKEHQPKKSKAAAELDDFYNMAAEWAKEG